VTPDTPQFSAIEHWFDNHDFSCQRVMSKLRSETGYMSKHKLLARKYKGWEKCNHLSLDEVVLSDLVLADIQAKIQKESTLDDYYTLDSYFTSRTRLQHA
jgi:hypothetical protein